MISTYFCKKGGVGKTTLLGEHADYLASIGKKVLIISIDDQNSIFEMYGKFGEVFAREDNYIEHILVGSISKEDAVIELREGIYGVKTLNTDMLSKKLTLERPFEKQFTNLLKAYDKQYDYVLVDLSPSSNRSSELVLELCESVVLIVELSKLGVNGLYNTVQYFVDNDIELEKVKYVLPNGFVKNKNVPVIALDELNAIVKKDLPNASVLPPMPEKSNIQMLQNIGIVVFDENAEGLNSYQKAQRKVVREILTELFEQIEL